MLLKDIKNLFLSELSHLYTPSECSELFIIFAENILNLDKISIRKQLENTIPPNEKCQFSTIISELKTGKPYQQILGQSFFFGNLFFVDENVLIPRPETEELIELSLKNLDKNTPLKILDIGSGSGCIPISLAKHLDKATITSIDISEKALKIAKKNAEYHQVNINFIKKDYLNENLEEIYDIIISNPPYIDIDEESKIPFSVKKFEPNIALFAPPNKVLAFYEKIAQDAQKHLRKGGMIFLEINQKLGSQTLQLFKKFEEAQLIKDLSGNERFIIVKK